jgi:hypothetical protein
MSPQRHVGVSVEPGTSRRSNADIGPRLAWAASFSCIGYFNEATGVNVIDIAVYRPRGLVGGLGRREAARRFTQKGLQILFAPPDLPLVSRFVPVVFATNDAAAWCFWAHCSAPARSVAPARCTPLTALPVQPEARPCFSVLSPCARPSRPWCMMGLPSLRPR